MSEYDSIIDLPHHTSEERPRMSRLARAAQFAPFAALTGYGAEIAEASRPTEDRVELDEYEIEKLNRKLAYALENMSEVEVTYFIPDINKKGGAYVSAKGLITEADEVFGVITLNRETKIKINDIKEIKTAEKDG